MDLKLYGMTAPDGTKHVMSADRKIQINVPAEAEERWAEIICRVNAHDELVKIAQEIVILGPGRCSLGKKLVENATAVLKAAGVIDG